MSIRLSIDPAGTTSKPRFTWKTGNAEPQSLQKLLVCRDPESWNVLILLSPDNQAILALDENRFAEWADPLSLRQRPQWQRKKFSNFPDMRNFTAPHKHCPTARLSIRDPSNDDMTNATNDWLPGFISLCNGDVKVAQGRPLLQSSLVSQSAFSGSAFEAEELRTDAMEN